MDNNVAIFIDDTSQTIQLELGCEMVVTSCGNWKQQIYFCFAFVLQFKIGRFLWLQFQTWNTIPCRDLLSENWQILPFVRYDEYKDEIFQKVSLTRVVNDLLIFLSKPNIKPAAFVKKTVF